MADAPATFVVPSGETNQPDALGQHRALVRDVKWVSDGANETAGKTVEASAVGLVHIYGIDFLGDVGSLYSGTDVVGSLKRVATDNDTWVITGLDAAGSALDLDTNDIAVARIRITGD